MQWDKHTKPPADVCPRRYCFFWMPQGRPKGLGGRPNRSLQDTLPQRNRVELDQGRCECPVGSCTRLDPVAGDRDWYEPCEPELQRDDLPWFYFIPSIEKLAPEHHERYLRESQALWEGPEDD